MKFCVAYVAVTYGPMTSDYCARFVATWHEYPPGVPTDLVVLCNGGALTTEQVIMFSGLKARMFVRPNEGKDIGAYAEAARTCCAAYDAVLFAGESIHFHRAGWLKRLVDCWIKMGPGLYGPFASNMVRTHMNTSAFFTSPLFLNQSTIDITDRYAWEHGPKAFWRWMASRGKPVRLVTWDGDYDCRAWRSPPNILWRGDQSNCLMWCNHAERWANATPRLRETWSRGADAPFQ